MSEAADDRAALTNMLVRERRARAEAEKLLETKSQDLFEANQRLAQLAESLAARERYAMAIFEAAQDGIMVISPSGLIESANPAAATLVAAASDQVEGSSIATWIDVPTIPRDLPGAGEAVASALRRQRLTEWTLTRTDGEQLPVRIAVGLMETDSESGLTLVMHDLSETRKAEEALRRTALVDLLTGLGNRAFLVQALDEVSHSSSEDDLCIISVDLLRFHRINDALGRAVGDEALRNVGSRLRGIAAAALSEDVRLHAWVPVRLSGDEFAVLLHADCVAEIVDREIARISRTLEEPMLFEGYTVPLEMCVGYAVGSSTHRDVESLVDRAMIALETAKSRAGQRVAAYESAMGVERSRIVRLEARIRDAIHGGEFVTYYQPRIDVVTGTIVACEALMRWNDPERGLVFPGEFIPVAELSSLILELGREVLDQVLVFQKRCMDLGLARPISINISHQEFALRSVMDSIQERVIDSDIPPKLIEFELQESIVTYDLEYSRGVLQALHGRGFRVAMDDFGTGHSSLGRLRELPIDVLKIDRSFVSAAPEDVQSEKILLAMVSLAEVLGATVVVEGVESETQLRIVEQAGHCEVQGFLYSPAVSSEQYEEMLRTQPWNRGDK
jgi:diguanylate cyclase (GGDEF)-like protein/PAS domain S-box-containing protein